MLIKKPGITSQLAEPIPSETTLKAITEALGVRLCLYELEDGELVKGVFGKGNLELVMAFDRPSKSYLYLHRKMSPTVVRTQSLNGSKEQP